METEEYYLEKIRQGKELISLAQEFFENNVYLQREINCCIKVEMDRYRLYLSEFRGE